MGQHWSGCRTIVQKDGCQHTNGPCQRHQEVAEELSSLDEGIYFVWQLINAGCCRNRLASFLKPDHTSLGVIFDRGLNLNKQICSVVRMSFSHLRQNQAFLKQGGP